jgi:hypothetical protein
MLGDVRGACAVGDAAIDGLFDRAGFLFEAERMSQQQRDAQDGADGIGHSLARDVRRRTVDGLVESTPVRAE